MALKKNNEMLAMFSMASLTDVIFLLLIFFMVTSTFVYPTALEVNLPQSNQQTAIKPGTRVYVDKEMNVYASFDDNEPQLLNSEEELMTFLALSQQNDPEQFIALYADEEVPYGKIVYLLDKGSKNNLKMVLATKPASSAYKTSSDTQQEETEENVN